MKLVGVFMTLAAISRAIVVIILGITSARSLFGASSEFDAASSRLYDTGLDLAGLRSVSGNTVVEAYYQEIGWYGVGYSYQADGYYKLTRGLGYFTLMFSFALAGIIILLRMRVIHAGYRLIPNGLRIRHPREVRSIDFPMGLHPLSSLRRPMVNL